MRYLIVGLTALGLLAVGVLHESRGDVGTDVPVVELRPVEGDERRTEPGRAGAERPSDRPGGPSDAETGGAEPAPAPAPAPAGGDDEDDDDRDDDGSDDDEDDDEGEDGGRDD